MYSEHTYSITYYEQGNVSISHDYSERVHNLLGEMNEKATQNIQENIDTENCGEWGSGGYSGPET